MSKIKKVVVEKFDEHERIVERITTEYVDGIETLKDSWRAPDTGIWPYVGDRWPYQGPYCGGTYSTKGDKTVVLN